MLSRFRNRGKGVIDPFTFVRYNAYYFLLVDVAFLFTQELVGKGKL